MRWSVGYNLLQKREGSYFPDSRRSSDTVKENQFDVEIITSIDSRVDETTSLLQKKNPSAKTRKTEIFSFLSTLDQYMSPPLYAALLALLVGLCPPVKKVIFDHDSFIYNSFTLAIKTCGKASVPLVLFCLGAQLKGIRESQTESQQNQESHHLLPVTIAVFLRMIITPIVVLSVVYLFGKYGSRWSQLANDPMFLLSIIVVGCTPTSINLSQITQVSGAFEEEMLSVLFWSYGAVCIPVCTTVVFLALYLINSI